MSHLDSDPPIFFDDGIFFDEPPPAIRKHTMSNILRNWSKLGRKDRLAYGKKIKTNLGKTPAPVAAPVPTVSALDALYTPAETLMNEMDDLETQLKAKRPALDAALDALMAGVEQEARTIEAIPDVTDATILAVGFAIAGVPQPAPAIAAPTDLSVTASSFEGGLDWHSHPLAGSTGMQAATTATPNDNASWVNHDTVPQSNGTVTGLPSGTRQYLRLRGIFPSGPGPWSDLAGKMVP